MYLSKWAPSDIEYLSISLKITQSDSYCNINFAHVALPSQTQLSKLNDFGWATYVSATHHHYINSAARIRVQRWNILRWTTESSNIMLYTVSQYHD